MLYCSIAFVDYLCEGNLCIDSKIINILRYFKDSVFAAEMKTHVFSLIIFSCETNLAIAEYYK